MPHFSSGNHSPRDISSKLPDILKGRHSVIGSKLGRSLDLSARTTTKCPPAADAVSEPRHRPLRLRQLSPIEDTGSVGTIVKRMQYTLDGQDIIKRKAEMYKQDFFNATLGRKHDKLTILF